MRRRSRTQMVKGLIGMGVIAWWGVGAGHGAPPPQPAYEKDAHKQIEAGVDAVRRDANPEVALQHKGVSARVLRFNTNGTWSVTKEGSHGLARQTATVLKRNAAGYAVSTGAGIKDRSAQRFASQMEIVDRYLRKAQEFTYEYTESWGRAEDIEKFNKGDCAEKSLWLAAKLAEAGLDARVVLGRKPEAAIGHAWVEVSVDGTPYILEATSREPPLLRSQAGPRYDAMYPTEAYFDRARGFTYVRPQASAKR